MEWTHVLTIRNNNRKKCWPHLSGQWERGEVWEVTKRWDIMWMLQWLAVGLACIGMLVMPGEAGPICAVADIFPGFC